MRISDYIFQHSFNTQKPWSSDRHQVMLYVADHIPSHYSEVVMSAMASQITGVSTACLTVCSGSENKTSKLCVTGLCEGSPPVSGGSPKKWPVTRKMFPFNDVIMKKTVVLYSNYAGNFMKIYSLGSNWQGSRMYIKKMRWHASLGRESTLKWCQNKNKAWALCRWLMLLIPLPGNLYSTEWDMRRYLIYVFGCSKSADISPDPWSTNVSELADACEYIQM